jgi:hypothetical protein
MSFLNPSLVQTNFRQQFSNGQTPSIIQYDTQPIFSTYAAPTSAEQLSSVCIYIALPAVSASTLLPIPLAWDRLMKVTIINIDPTNGILVVAQDTQTPTPALQQFTLPPNGGLFSMDLWALANVPQNPTTFGFFMAQWFLWPVDAGTGLIPSADPVNVRIAMVGF